MKRETLKKRLGNRYRFEEKLSLEEVKEIQRQNVKGFCECNVSVLTAGCVRISAVLYRSGGSLRLGYDILVRESLDALEWICYDNPNDEVSLEEDKMLAVLDRVVRENGLSYTESSFRRLKGKSRKPV